MDLHNALIEVRFYIHIDYVFGNDVFTGCVLGEIKNAAQNIMFFIEEILDVFVLNRIAVIVFIHA